MYYCNPCILSTKRGQQDVAVRPLAIGDTDRTKMKTLQSTLLHLYRRPLVVYLSIVIRVTSVMSRSSRLNSSSFRQPHLLRGTRLFTISCYEIDKPNDARNIALIYIPKDQITSL